MIIEFISCIGLMWILRYGSILNLPRKSICKFKIFKELFNCSLCLGFWCGVIIAISSNYIEQNNKLIFLPLCSSALCWFFDSILDLIQEATNKIDS